MDTDRQAELTRRRSDLSVFCSRAENVVVKDGHLESGALELPEVRSEGKSLSM